MKRYVLKLTFLIYTLGVTIGCKKRTEIVPTIDSNLFKSYTDIYAGHSLRLYGYEGEIDTTYNGADTIYLNVSEDSIGLNGQSFKHIFINTSNHNYAQETDYISGAGGGIVRSFRIENDSLFVRQSFGFSFFDVLVFKGKKL